VDAQSGKGFKFYNTFLSLRYEIDGQKNSKPDLKKGDGFSFKNILKLNWDKSLT